MSIPIRRIKNKRPLYPVILTVSLLLVFVGVRVPSFLGAHSPKQQSRAVIETTVKDSQDDGSRKNLVDAVCQDYVKLDIPTQFIAYSRQENQKVSFIPLELFSARAPPFLIA